ncbi:MAG: hypothetical protein NC816_05840 [Candidatus Omnitrophica bacterium]|nr:hypothetical protein [Candidatus Omnitrophota bacterium]MCM8824388.1 hypothetical protein [Candidatus Omnitrophota bacterium]MCM8833421.1 hypothetical protein [Candidatus Omnitrophota bacterium]
MNKSSKPIRLSAHAKIRASLRGATEEEIIETVKTSEWQTYELNKFEYQKDFIFNQFWNNKFYKTKQLKPIFVEEEKEIVVVTVYVYYF